MNNKPFISLFAFLQRSDQMLSSLRTLVHGCYFESSLLLRIKRKDRSKVELSKHKAAGFRELKKQTKEALAHKSQITELLVTFVVTYHQSKRNHDFGSQKTLVFSQMEHLISLGNIHYGESNIKFELEKEVQDKVVVLSEKQQYNVARLIENNRIRRV